MHLAFKRSLGGEKRNISTKFEMKYLGMMHYLLRMEVWHSADGIFLVQGKYEVDILKRFIILEY